VRPIGRNAQTRSHCNKFAQPYVGATAQSQIFGQSDLASS
jgi:hypothetical protein